MYALELNNDDALHHLLQGKESYYALSFEKALQELEKSKELYYQNIEELAKGEELYDAHLFTALCHFSQKNIEKTKTEMNQAFFLNPKRKLDPKLYPPNFIDFFNKTTAHHRLLLTSKLEITSDPPFAMVYINGFRMGLTPLILKEWSEGKHYITILLDEYKDWHSSTTLLATRTEKVHAKLSFLETPSWITKSPISRAHPQEGSSTEIENFLKKMEEAPTEYSWKNSIWTWSIAAIAIGGITYGILKAQNQREERGNASSLPKITATLP